MYPPGGARQIQPHRQRCLFTLVCMRYIELNPVRARMVATPEDYRWSSCRYRLGRSGWDWLEPDHATLRWETMTPSGRNATGTICGPRYPKVNGI